MCTVTKKHRNPKCKKCQKYLVLICTSFINRNVVELEYQCFDCYPTTLEFNNKKAETEKLKSR